MLFRDMHHHTNTLALIVELFQKKNQPTSKKPSIRPSMNLPSILVEALLLRNSTFPEINVEKRHELSLPCLRIRVRRSRGSLPRNLVFPGTSPSHIPPLTGKPENHQQENRILVDVI